MVSRRSFGTALRSISAPRCRSRACALTMCCGFRQLRQMAEESLAVRRLRQEWLLLQEIARLNPGVVEVLSRRRLADGETFEIALHQTCGITSWTEGRPVLARSHRVTFRFPRFFPSTPIEAYLATPVLHPNVDPSDGFVCLWTRSSSGDTVMEAVRRLQQIIAWKLVNFEATHVMQPALNPPGPLDFTPMIESTA